MTVHPIPPVFDSDSKILILGSFPSVKSREAGFFYGHPQNRFWKVLAAVFGENVPDSVDEKVAFLRRNRVALWDVIGSCEIEGSSDASIKNATPNDLSVIFAAADIKAVFVNGRTAQRYYNRYVLPVTGRESVCLPSTSPANAAWSTEKLTGEWRSILGCVTGLNPEKRAVVYVHGQGGSAGEADRLKPLFENCAVHGFDYKASAPREAAAEFPAYFGSIFRKYDKVTLVANSLGAFFSMYALGGTHAFRFEKAFFISPVVDMEALILRMMTSAGVSEEALREKGRIATDSGAELSWDYLKSVREKSLEWDVPTAVLYGENDFLVPYGEILKFADKTGAIVTVMKNGEHWFHTEEQLAFLDRWILDNK